jgi:hypothetical protein
VRPIDSTAETRRDGRQPELGEGVSISRQPRVSTSRLDVSDATEFIEGVKQPELG